MKYIIKYVLIDKIYIYYIKMYNKYKIMFIALKIYFFWKQNIEGGKQNSKVVDCL